MNHKRITTMSIILATLMLVSLFAVLSSAASVSGQVLAGTGPAMTSHYISSPPTWYSGWADFFAVDSSGTLWHGANGNWDSLGGVCTSSPAAVSWWSSDLRLDVFVRGTDGALWQQYYENGWSTWIPLGGQLSLGTGPAVSSWSAGRLDVFVQGTDNQLWHKWWNGASWSGWESLGGKLTASPAATWKVDSANNIYVFVRGTDGAVWQKYWNGAAWSSWKSLGGQLAPNTGPAVNEVLTLVVQGTDGQLWWGKPSEGVWHTFPYAPREALSAASPAATVTPDDHGLVCVSSNSGNIWQCASDISGWGQWTSAGSPP